MISRKGGPASFALVLVIASAVGLFLRLQDIRTESFWSDEVTQLEWTDQPLGAFLSQRWERADPPLNEIIVWTWNNGLRTWAPQLAANEAAVRAPALLFGVMTIPAIGIAAAAAFGRWPGTLAALLLATNPHHVRYSQEARMYALAVLLSTIAVVFLVRTLRNGQRRDGLAFGALAAAAFYAHFYSFLLLAASIGATLALLIGSTRGTWQLRWRTGAPGLRALFRGELFGLMLVMPFLSAVAFHMWTSGRGARPWLASLGTPGLQSVILAAKTYGVDQLQSVVTALAPGGVDQVSVAAGLVALSLALAAGAVMRRDDEPATLRAHLLALALVPPLIVLGVSRLRPVYHPRYLLFITPALVMICVRSRSALVAAALAVPVFVGLWVEPRYHQWLETPDYREAAHRIAGRCVGSDILEGPAIHRRPLQFYMRLAGGPCETYAVLNPSGIPTLAYDSSELSDPGHAVPVSRRFVVDTIPLAEAGQVAQGHGRPPGAHGQDELIFIGRSDPVLRVWLAEAR